MLPYVVSHEFYTPSLMLCWLELANISFTDTVAWRKNEHFREVEIFSSNCIPPETVSNVYYYLESFKKHNLDKKFQRFDCWDTKMTLFYQNFGAI